MRTIRKILYAAGLALALAAASHTSADAQASAARWRGTGNEQLIEQAVRRYGYRPNRLTTAQLYAIDRAWADLLGPTTRRVALNRAQATAIVYLALVEPTESAHAGRDRDDYDRPGGGYPGRPGAWSAECDAMESDAYRLGTLVSAPRNGGMFLDESARGPARTLARQIQQRALQCRVPAAADRAGEVLTTLADARPRRGAVESRVNALKLAIHEATPSRGGR